MPVKVDQLQIVLYPDPVLRKRAAPIELNDEVREVAARMITLMHEAHGVGLAAPQVGLSWRMFVANPTGEPQDDRVFINPELRDPAEIVAVQSEGCLSIPDVHADIRRPQSISVDATDLDGNRFTLTDDALPARIWQHETDHLNGVLILDRMSRLDKIAHRRVIKDLEADYAQ
ncbi:MAG: peptide deformylase [Phycisphaera sp.]|nr:peptide deformylase [Phycisphaera sp.]